MADTKANIIITMSSIVLTLSLGWRPVLIAGLVLALMGIGYRRLSITPAAVGPIKELVRKVDLGELSKAMQGWLAQPPPSMREALTQWAGQREIEIE